jgi:hypothetical protein
MKKQKKRTSKSKAHIAPPAAPVRGDDTAETRRDVLRRYRNRGIGLVVIATAGWFIVDDVQATAREHDLTRIGNGIPTVVQIHDPNCALCAALQKETRAAIKDFEGDDLQFLVANIRDSRGRKLATDNSVGHVTLLLFDGEGKRRDILRGSRDRTELKPLFRKFVSRHGR